MKNNRTRKSWVLFCAAGLTVVGASLASGAVMMRGADQPIPTMPKRIVINAEGLSPESAAELRRMAHLMEERNRPSAGPMVDVERPEPKEVAEEEAKELFGEAEVEAATADPDKVAKESFAKSKAPRGSQRTMKVEERDPQGPALSAGETAEEDIFAEDGEAISIDDLLADSSESWDTPMEATAPEAEDVTEGESFADAEVLDEAAFEKLLAEIQQAQEETEITEVAEETPVETAEEVASTEPEAAEAVSEPVPELVTPAEELAQAEVEESIEADLAEEGWSADDWLADEAIDVEELLAEEPADEIVDAEVVEAPIDEVVETAPEPASVEDISDTLEVAEITEPGLQAAETPVPTEAPEVVDLGSEAPEEAIEESVEVVTFDELADPEAPEEAPVDPVVDDVFGVEDSNAVDVDDVAGMLAEDEDNFAFANEAETWSDPIPEGASIDEQLKAQPVYGPNEYGDAIPQPAFAPTADRATFPTAAEASKFDEETVSVDFPDEDIRTIIRQVADLYELNVVIPDTLVGSTSIKLRNVTWRQVFRVVLEPIGYTYVEDRNIITIKSSDELLQEPTDTRVFVVNYANAGELQNSITPLVDSAAGGRLQVDRRSNALVITERPSRFNNIQEIIQRLDRPTPQVMIESKFIEILDTDIKSLGVDWQSLAGTSINSSVNRNAEYKNEQNPVNFTAGSFTGGGTDGHMQGSASGSTTLPLYNADGAVVGYTTANVSESLQAEFSGFIEAATSTVTDTAVLSIPTFNVVLAALKELDDTKIVSNPTVVTLNNTEATINIGREYPIPNYSYNDERGTFEVSGFEYKPIGILLRVTPQVNAAGFINLRILPEVSDIEREVEFGGASGAKIPLIRIKKTESEITIKDGYTLAIGGLVSESEVNDTSRVPLLGDIPLLGNFFRYEKTTKDRQNLVIFITAKTLNPDGSSYEEIVDPRTLHRMGITDADLPGYEIPDTERDLYREIRKTRLEKQEAVTEKVLAKQLSKMNEEDEDNFPENKRRRR